MSQISTKFLKNLAITNAKIANTTIDLTSKVTNQLPIANGGTNASTASSAFGNLSPLTTKGDLLAFSTVNARLPVGTDGFVLTADSTNSLGISWQAASSGGSSVQPSASSLVSLITRNGNPSGGAINPTISTGFQGAFTSYTGINEMWAEFGSAGSHTITATPAFDNGTFLGQMIIVQGSNGATTNGFTLQDEGTQAGSGLQLTTSTFTFAKYSTLCLLWNGSFWVELYRRA